MATLPNSNIDAVPAESPTQTDPFPALDPITTFDLVGPTAANRSPNALKQRDFTLRDRVNLLVANMNHISTGDAVDSAILFLPRDGSNPMTGDLDMGGKQFTNYGVLLASPTSTPNDYVQVSAGTYQKADGTGHVVYAGGSVQITTPVGGGQTRYDLVHLNDSGTLAVTQGVAGTPGVVPDFLSDELTIAVVKVDETGTIVVNAADITDVRPFLAADQNARTLQTYLIDDTAPSLNQVLSWDGNKWAPTGAVPGWALKVEVSGESALSAVTVGESGCDYTDIDSAITYIGALTRSQARQCAIYLFEKRNGQDWTISSGITIPTWTRLIGMGKPTLKTTVSTGNVITLDTGASLENVYIEVGAVGWTYQVYTNTTDTSFVNVDVRFEQNSVGTAHAYGIGASAKRVTVSRCRLLPYSSDDTKGCLGIEVIDGAEDIFMSQLYLQGDSLLLDIGNSGNDVENVQIIGVTLRSRSSTATYALGYIGGKVTLVGVDAVIKTPGATYGLYLVSDAVEDILTVHGLHIESTSSDDIIGLHVGNFCSITNFVVENCRVTTGGCRATCGYVTYGYSDSNPAVGVGGNQAQFTNLRVSRNTINAPGIASTTTAIQVIISGCSVSGTGTSASIKGQSGANDWYVSNCIVDVATDPNSGTGWVYSTTFGSHETVV
jgi:hypothetical protein